MSRTTDLLEEIAALTAMLTAAEARDKRKDERIARLEKLVAAFKQAAFGLRSESSDPDQFELALEDLETAIAVIHAKVRAAIQLAHCWAHARRKLIEITRTGPAPIAGEGLTLIRDLYAIEADIRGSDPATRLAVRQDCTGPILARIDYWLAHHRARASTKSPLGEALAYIAKYRIGLRRLLTEGCVEIDNNTVNTVERTIRPIALNRKNVLFAGNDAGAENWAIIASLIKTCKMNRVDPHAWLSATLTAIVKA